MPEPQSVFVTQAPPSESLPGALCAQRPVATSQKSELQSVLMAQDAPSGLSSPLRVQTPVARLQMPELQSVFAAQEAPSGLPASPERVHRPVARLQMPDLQSVFVAQAAPPGACANADANTIFVTAAAAINFVTIERNDALRRLGPIRRWILHRIKSLGSPSPRIAGRNAFFLAAALPGGHRSTCVAAAVGPTSFAWRGENVRRRSSAPPWDSRCRDPTSRDTALV